jgi:predicted RNA binding protein YcfA (HicA-like mRNA interferase family)
VIAILEAHGFELQPQGATSHRKYRHPDGRYVTVAAHDFGAIVLIKTLESMIRQSCLPKSLFRK